jgi:hypothetical protein
MMFPKLRVQKLIVAGTTTLIRTIVGLQAKIIVATETELPIYSIQVMRPNNHPHQD